MRNLRNNHTADVLRSFVMEIGQTTPLQKALCFFESNAIQLLIHYKVNVGIRSVTSFLSK